MPEPDKIPIEKPLELQPINDMSVTGLVVAAKKKLKNKKMSWKIIAAIAVLALSIIWFVVWYNLQLRPLDSNGQPKIVKIESGSAPSKIGQQLEDESIIRSSSAFDIYVRLNRQGNFLQAGTYQLSPSESLGEIVSHLVKGSIYTFDIMFYPGATLVDNTAKSEDKKLDVTSVLRRAGYSDQEISTALSKTYESQLFSGKPAGSDLEGYILGDTYRFNVGVSVEDILQRIFDDFYEKIKNEGLIEKFSARKLTLFQAITLASIVQSEDNNESTQPQVAQVFYSRMEEGMMLGSDVTYQYIADKTGVARDPNLDSPYNTRRFAGLPPGPISVPGMSALRAVAEPASGDYMYFLSGDDEKMYFTETIDEHNANIRNHCAIKCSVL